MCIQSGSLGKAEIRDHDIGRTLTNHEGSVIRIGTNVDWRDAQISKLKPRDTVYIEPLVNDTAALPRCARAGGY